MTRDPFVLHASTNLEDSIKSFCELGITSAPVIDVYGDIKGLITELGLIRLYFRVHGKGETKDQIAYHFDLLEKAETVTEDTPINDTIKSLLQSHIHRVVVLDKHKKIIGIISPKDLLKVFNGDSESRLQKDLKVAREDLKKTVGKLKDSEDLSNRYFSYLESAPFMIHSVNEEGRVIMANKRLSTALGYEPGELIGKSLLDLFEGDNGNKAMVGLKALMKDGIHPPVITAMIRKDKSAVRVEAVSTALYNELGDFVGTITMSRSLASDNMLRALNGVLDKSAKPFD